MGLVIVPWINKACLQQKNLIFLEILEQIFSKMYNNNLLSFVNVPCWHYYDYILLKFIWKYNNYIVYYFSEFIGAKIFQWSLQQVTNIIIY